MSDVLDRVLAGPFLRYTTETEANVWFATSTPLGQKDFVVEFWDPSPPKTGRIFYEPAGTNIVGASADPLSTRIAARLHVHVVRVSFSKRLQPNKVYAYRLLLDPSVGSGVPVDAPGILDRLVDGLPLPAKAKKFASFVLSDPTNFWLWGLPSQADQVIAKASEQLAIAVKHIVSRKVTAADLQPLAAPTSLFFFGNPFTFSEQMPEAVLQAIVSLAKKLAGFAPVADESIKAIYAAAFLLAWSDKLWKKELGELEPALAGLTSCVTGTQLLMANTPSYMLGTSPASAGFSERTMGLGGVAGAVVSSLGRIANVFVNGTFADWPNTPQNVPQSVTSLDILKAFVGAQATVASTFVLPGPPRTGCVARGDSADSVLTQKIIPDRIATAVCIEPVLRTLDGAWREAPIMAIKHDVSLLLTFTGGSAFVAESGDQLGSEPDATYDTSSEGILRGKVFEVAASLGGVAASAPPTQSVAIVVQREAMTARYASVKRAGDKVSLSIEPIESSEKVFDIVLPAHGRIFEVTSSRDGLHLGNRFWKRSKAAELSQGDRDVSFLKGVRVGIYAIGERTPRAFSDADQVGWVNLALDGVDDGEYLLRIEGNETFDHVGPDLQPYVGSTATTFKNRVWLQQSFPVQVVGGRIASVDNEPVPALTFRLLIDPAWMHSVRATKRTGRTVSLVVLHRTDSGGKGAGDAAAEATAWQKTSRDKKGAHYLLARDGTLVKCADESESIGHAGFDHLTSWQGRNALNSFSIGVEISKEETWDRYTEKQYTALIKFLRRFRTTTRSDVVVSPVDINGHSDFRLQEADGTHPIRLGDRNDPGLAFDWTRLERRFLGMRRKGDDAPKLFDEWVDPPSEVVIDRNGFNSKSRADRRREGPTYHLTKKRANPTATWAAEIRDALDRFDARYLPGTAPGDIEADLRKDLEDIGYFVTPAATPASREILNAAAQAFRSHFFSGPRRTYFQTKIDRPGSGETWATIDPYVWSTEEEKETPVMVPEGKLTITWVHEVADYVRTARARADVKDPGYDGEGGWKEAREAEESEANAIASPATP